MYPDPRWGIVEFLIIMALLLLAYITGFMAGVLSN